MQAQTTTTVQKLKKRIGFALAFGTTSAVLALQVTSLFAEVLPETTAKLIAIPADVGAIALSIYALKRVSQWVRR